MAEGEIPINPQDLPIDTTPLEESNVYTGYFRRATVSPKPSKGGLVFAALQFEVAEGDFEGRTVMMQYMPLPVKVTDTMNKAQRIRAIDATHVPFGRFARAFGIKSNNMPEVTLAAPDSLGRWQEWISQFYDQTGKFTIRNQEFPEGSGRLRSGVNDFVV